MSDPSNWLLHDHRRYEAVLVECEMAAGAAQWKEATRLFYSFVEDLKLHMRMEDEVLYPLFTEEGGDPQGEIARLGDEHDDIVRLLGDLHHVISAHDFDHFEACLEPLYEVMTRHNRHEEAVFLVRGSDSILMRREEIMARLNALQPGADRRSWEF